MNTTNSLRLAYPSKWLCLLIVKKWPGEQKKPNKQRTKQQSSVPCLIAIKVLLSHKFLEDNFELDKSKNGDHFGVVIISGSISGLEIISGVVQMPYSLD